MAAASRETSRAHIASGHRLDKARGVQVLFNRKMSQREGVITAVKVHLSAVPEVRSHDRDDAARLYEATQPFEYSRHRFLCRHVLEKVRDEDPIEVLPGQIDFKYIANDNLDLGVTWP